jgi:hypothetical protein
MTTDAPTPPHGFPGTGWPALDQRTSGNGRRHARVERQPRDDTTRYLCAAAHLDAGFADRAIREHLIEDTRSIPASPGVDAAAVLGEAVAARTRRKLRDIGLIVLMIGVLFLAPVEFVMGWIVVACLASVPAAVSAMKKQQVSQSKQTMYAVGGLVGLAALFFLVSPVLDSLTGSGSGANPFGSSSSYYYEPPESTSDGLLIGAIVVVLGMLAVVVADRFVVWRHLNDRFWPTRLSRVEPWLRDRPIFQFSADRQVTQLKRYANPRDTVAFQGRTGGPGVPIVVYRDFVPFVGAGTPVEPWSIAVPLQELPDAEPTAQLTTNTLYQGIHDEVMSLREASLLAPGRRLDGLDLSEQVIVSADELVDHLAEPDAADFLKEPGVPPYTKIRRERADAIKGDPLEWARYYQCYRVETWDRDLVVTVFVHVAVGRGALYVEWTPCVLRPVKKKYQAIDAMPRSPLRPVFRALVDLLRMPVSMPVRVHSVFSFLRPLPQDHGMVASDAYGAAASLRELAADGEVHNYFQLADVDRYLKMMESRLVLAVSRMIRAAGYSPASFDEQAATVVNNNVQIAGSVGGDVVVGSGNRTRSTPAAQKK